MLWVLQPNLYSEPGYVRLRAALERLGSPHVVVKPVPMSATDAHDARLVPVDCPGGQLEDIPEPAIDATRSIMVMGSYTLVEIGLARGWKPCAFTQNINFKAWTAALPDSWLLNGAGTVARFADAFFYSEAFVRPVDDSKAFKGEVYTSAAFAEWQQRVLAIPPQDRAQHMHNGRLVALLDENTEVVVAPPREILSETRFFVVKGEPVTWSVYKRGDTSFWHGMKLDHWARADDEIIAFARQVVEHWQPNDAFVVDIAQTPHGPRVVEYNCLNAAGFYACDVMALVSALEGLIQG